MKIYKLTRDENHACSLSIKDGVHILPPTLLASDEGLIWPTMLAAQTILLDYFGEENHAGPKSEVLARAFVHYLNRLGEEWEITEEQVTLAVTDIFVRSKVMFDKELPSLEYVGGQRRDTLRLNA